MEKNDKILKNLNRTYIRVFADGNVCFICFHVEDYKIKVNTKFKNDPDWKRISDEYNTWVASIGNQYQNYIYDFYLDHFTK